MRAAVDAEPAVQRTVDVRSTGAMSHTATLKSTTGRLYAGTPLLDHIIEQMATRFGPMQQKAAGVCCLVPSVVVIVTAVSVESMI